MMLAGEISFESVGKLAGIVLLCFVAVLFVATKLMERLKGPKPPRED